MNDSIKRSDGNRILLFEDTPDTCSQLADHLRDTLNSETTACLTVDRFLQAINVGQVEFDYVLIDYKVEQLQGGIQTGMDLVERLVDTDYCDVPTILYTMRQDMPQDVKQRAKDLGVYLTRRQGLATLIADLQKKLRTLDGIRDILDRMLARRRSLGNILGGMDIGFQVVDAYGHVHYQDDAFRRYVGESGRRGRLCFCKCHGYPLEHGTCRNCLMKIGQKRLAQEDGNRRIFFTPTYPDGPGTQPICEYLDVTATPIGGVSGGDLMGVIESVSVMPAWPHIAALPRDEHLDILLKSLQDFGYEEVTIYERHARALVPVAPSGQKPKAVKLSGKQKFRSETAQAPLCRELLDCSCLDPENPLANKTLSRFLVGLFNAQGGFIGLVALGYKPNGPRDAAWIDKDVWAEAVHPGHETCVVRPSSLMIVSEIARVLATKGPGFTPGALPSPVSDVLRAVHRRLVKLIASRHEEEVGVKTLLNVLIESVPEIGSIHVRRIEGESAVLWNGVGPYIEVADPRTPVHPARWVASTVVDNAKPIFRNNVTPADITQYTPEQQAVLGRFRSHGTWPLKADGTVVGILVIMASPEKFFTPPRCYLCSRVSDLLAVCLRDDIDVSNAVIAEEKQRAELAYQIGYTMRTRVAALRAHLDQLRRDCEGEHSDEIDEMEHAIDFFWRTGTVSGKILRARELRRDWQETNLSDLVAGVVLNMKDDRITFLPSPAPITVMGDRGQLEDIFVELLDNAKSFAPATGGSITVATARDRRNAFVTVADNGPGIPSDMKSRVFDMFEHAPGEKRMGLGLSYAREVARIHAGEIVEVGEPGKGARFVVTLPTQNNTEGRRST